MPHFFILHLVLIALIENPDQKKLTVPTEWSPDFSIYVASGGGMINESVKVAFYYDSCVYEKRVGAKKTKKCVRLTGDKRNAILDRLREFKIEEVRTRSTSLKLDAGNTSICFRLADQETCLNDGATEEVLEADYGKFSPAYQFLINYANPSKK